MIQPRSLLFSLLTVVPAFAQQPSSPTPPSLGERVDAICRPCAAADGPGAVVLVGRGDEIVLQRAYGLADLERAVPLTPDSVFDIGSTSKQFTAACVLLLADAGKLQLTDPVRKHLAELPPCFEPVTLRHLLLHTSGIPDYIGLLVAAGADLEDRTTADEALAALTHVEALAFATGSKWAYSNSNYFLLSAVVQRVAGRTLAEFAHERIFTPLRMANTHVHDDINRLVPHRALSYTRQPGGEWRWNYSGWEQTGDGAVMTTVADLFRWARNFHRGTVGGDHLLQAMARPGALDDGTPLRYGMGLMFPIVNSTPMVSHGGAWAGYRAELLRVPGEDLIVICLCNRDDVDPTRMCRAIAAAAMAP